MILICSKKDDRSAERVFKILQKNEEVFYLCLDDYLSHEPSIIFLGGNIENKINIDLCRVSAIYYRALVFPYLPNSEMPEMYRNFLNRELITMFLGQLMLRPVRWINHPFYSHLANYKIIQMEKAVSVGLNLPDTCIATTPKMLFEFYDKKRNMGSGVITKAIHLGYVQSKNSDEDEIIFTQDVDINSVDDIPDGQPLLFQEKIKPDYEIRCFVIGSKVLAVKIETKECYSDYREIDDSLLKAEILGLPESVQNSCAQLTKNFNLEYSAIDLIYKDGKYFFIDFNPTGEWWWYEERTGLPISYSIARLLVDNNC